jgi:APA family basic amino acid/polyamine antiporter
VGSLPLITWVRFFIWMAVGLVIYAFWGRRNSRVATGELAAEALDADPVASGRR